MEDEAVALSTWPNVIKIVAHYQTLAPSKRPQNNLFYNTFVEYSTDKLVPVKLQLFIDLAWILCPFLKLFQTDKQMIPFLCEALESFTRRLMKMCVCVETCSG